MGERQEAILDSEEVDIHLNVMIRLTLVVLANVFVREEVDTIFDAIRDDLMGTVDYMKLERVIEMQRMVAHNLRDEHCEVVQ